MVIGCARSDAWEPVFAMPPPLVEVATTGKASAASQRWIKSQHGADTRKGWKAPRLVGPIPTIRSVCRFDAVGSVQSDRR